MYTLFSPKRTSWVHLSKLIWTNVANSQNNKYVEFNILRFQHSCTKLSLKRLAQWVLWAQVAFWLLCKLSYRIFSNKSSPGQNIKQAPLSNERPPPSTLFSGTVAIQEECDDLHVTDEDYEIITILYTCTLIHYCEKWVNYMGITIRLISNNCFNKRNNLNIDLGISRIML